MAKMTFKCLKCDTQKVVEFNPGDKAEELTPNCEECGERMKRMFNIGKGNSMDNMTFEVARMMSYHTSK